MQSSKLILAFIFLFGILGTSNLIADDDLDTNFAIYEGQTISYMLEAPEDWILNLDDAQHDEMSACMFPQTMTYSDAKLAVNIWIFKLDSLSFPEFISNDSSYYIKSDPTIKFDKRDSIRISENLYAVALRTTDPGGRYSLSMVGYIDAVTEVIVYELNMKNYSFFLIGAVKFEEALKKFAFIK